ncbi:acyltransferase domain-containing protein, partial [Micromonospora parva]|uniref:acyltransferase domain-containing protein n=1 Tax=Micromonospora parva TaxID=1464048 RepID=UPI0033F71275
VDEPSPHVDWESGAVRLLTEERQWSVGERVRRAGVSSFGISGTNAHVIIEEAPTPEPADETDEPATNTGPVPWVLSAHSEQSLREQARRLHTHLTEHPEFRAVDVGFSLVTTRVLLPYRAVVQAGEREQALRALDALATGLTDPALVTGLAKKERGKLTMVFPGQGSQWPDMARDLLNTSEAFRDTVAACEAALAPYVDWRLTDVLSGAAGSARLLDRVDVVQPALFAMMVSLAEVWRSLGVVPDAVVGHSQGEIAAAYVAGGLSLPDAARIVAQRSKAVTALSGKGAMMVVGLPADEVEQHLGPWRDELSVATVNSMRSVVVSGGPAALDELGRELSRIGAFRWMVPGVDFAAHSPHVEMLRDELLRLLAATEPRTGMIPYYSTTTANWISTTELDAGYWYRNLREPVRFAQSVRGLLADGHRIFVESAPQPVLAMNVQEAFDDLPDTDTLVVESLRRDDGALDRLITSAAQVFVHGVPVDWTSVLRGGRIVPLPTYGFVGERFWLVGGSGGQDVSGLGLGVAG